MSTPPKTRRACLKGDITLSVRETIVKHAMLEKGDTVVCAVSGGLDSIVMLRLLAVMQDEFGLKIIVAHLNHNLRGRESLRDFNFVKRIASKLGFKFAGATLKKGELSGSGVQDHARTMRYAFLFKTAVKYRAAKICVGHTLDDNAETVLMRFLKGSGLHGLSGIPAKRGIIVRPLIGIERADIERFAKENSILFVTDSSNLTGKYLRNDIRQHLLPIIKKRYNPNIIETLGRESRILRADDDYLSGVAVRALKFTVIERKKGVIVLDRLKLRSAHQAVLARFFVKITEDLIGAADTNSSHVETFIKMLRGAKPNAGFHAKGVWVEREYDRIIFSNFPPARARGFNLTLRVPGITELDGVFTATLLDKPPVFSRSETETAYFDYDEICRANHLDGACALRIRSMMPGDRIVPFGMKGHKKVKEIFIEEKIPTARRLYAPLVVSGDGVMVLWLTGIKQSDLCKVKKTTKRILKIEFKKA
ncbi:MAG: tRNA lysidine(34) synthetase TilS [Deltaproteobacteria bacterium]|nr:tRNA lysidine(34) synthetase TilS [Deltaproteobacteria bacterium]